MLVNKIVNITFLKSLFAEEIHYKSKVDSKFRLKA
jgi:hypothetical protein